MYNQFISPDTHIFPKIRIAQLQQLPIPLLDLSHKPDKAKHDNLVSLVDKMLELKQKEAVEPNPDIKTMIARQITGIDAAIDAAVYALYGLTQEEIKIVVGAYEY